MSDKIKVMVVGQGSIKCNENVLPNSGNTCGMNIVNKEGDMLVPKKEIVFPLTNPYKDMDFPSSSKKLKFKKPYWHKGKLKYK